MKRTSLSMPEIGLIAGTRAALGAGVGLLLADRLEPGQRRAIGWTLLAVGVASTVPILVQLLAPEEHRPTRRSALAALDDERPLSHPAGVGESI
jgi:hypothetical protein